MRSARKYTNAEHAHGKPDGSNQCSIVCAPGFERPFEAAADRFVYVPADVLDLDGGMLDVEPAADFEGCLQDFVLGVVAVDNHVHGGHELANRSSPDMDVVHVRDT